MRHLPFLMLALPLLAACGEAETAAPQTAEAPKAVAPAAVAAVPVDLEAACRDVVDSSFGQTGDAVTFKAAGEGRAEVSWAAPVDGGVLSFECRIDGDHAGLFRDGRLMSADVQLAAPAAEKEAR